jgi:hypothetical protein
MPRRPRICPGGLVCHVPNCAAARLALIERDGDHKAFERVRLAASRRRTGGFRAAAYAHAPGGWRNRSCCCRHSDGTSNEKSNAHGAASCRWRDPAALSGRPGHPTTTLAGVMLPWPAQRMWAWPADDPPWSPLPKGGGRADRPRFIVQCGCDRLAACPPPTLRCPIRTNIPIGCRKSIPAPAATGSSDWP